MFAPVPSETKPSHDAGEAGIGQRGIQTRQVLLEFEEPLAKGANRFVERRSVHPADVEKRKGSRAFRNQLAVDEYPPFML
jgi:hypothetical protein